MGAGDSNTGVLQQRGGEEGKDNAEGFYPAESPPWKNLTDVCLDISSIYGERSEFRRITVADKNQWVGPSTSVPV